MTYYFFSYIIVNCQKSNKKCDDERPCQRCIRHNLTETCSDSIRKERKERNDLSALEDQQRQQESSKRKRTAQSSHAAPVTKKRVQVKRACGK